jgi:hypothetical protein
MCGSLPEVYCKGMENTETDKIPKDQEGLIHALAYDVVCGVKRQDNDVVDVWVNMELSKIKYAELVDLEKKKLIKLSAIESGEWANRGERATLTELGKEYFNRFLNNIETATWWKVEAQERDAENIATVQVNDSNDKHVYIHGVPFVRQGRSSCYFPTYREAINLVAKNIEIEEGGKAYQDAHNLVKKAEEKIKNLTNLLTEQKAVLPALKAMADKANEKAAAVRALGVMANEKGSTAP